MWPNSTHFRSGSPMNAIHQYVRNWGMIHIASICGLLLVTIGCQSQGGLTKPGMSNWLRGAGRVKASLPADAHSSSFSSTQSPQASPAWAGDAIPQKTLWRGDASGKPSLVSEVEASSRVSSAADRLVEVSADASESAPEGKSVRAATMPANPTKYAVASPDSAEQGMAHNSRKGSDPALVHADHASASSARNGSLSGQSNQTPHRAVQGPVDAGNELARKLGEKDFAGQVQPGSAKLADASETRRPSSPNVSPLASQPVTDTGTGSLSTSYSTAGRQEDVQVGGSLNAGSDTTTRADAAESLGSMAVGAEPLIEPLQLNLPTALAMVSGQHPVVALAQWRVREAYARLSQTRVLWLPTLQPGIGFDKHDGNLQNSEGEIRDVHRNSLQYGLGTGATGAGTTMRPGILAQFRLADAIFEPRIAQSQAWAREHAAEGAVQEQLLQVSLAYIQLLDAEQARRIVERTQASTTELAKLTKDFAVTGQGLQADADRLETELRLVDSRLLTAQERIEVAAARLAEQLHLPADQPLAVLDATVVPLYMTPLECDRTTLIRTGLITRPELKEAQALVAAADEQYRRQKVAPFLPSVLLGYSTTDFGGGRGSRVGHMGDRYDFDAIVSWELRNLGWGEAAARREADSRRQQTHFTQVRLLDQVAREISEAHIQVMHRAARIRVTESAIQVAENSLERNLTRIRDGQGLPLEALQSIQALENAQQAYLESVSDHNAAQFRLQRALGWTGLENEIHYESR